MQSSSCINALVNISTKGGSNHQGARHSAGRPADPGRGERTGGAGRGDGTPVHPQMPRGAPGRAEAQHVSAGAVAYRAPPQAQRRREEEHAHGSVGLSRDGVYSARHRLRQITNAGTTRLLFQGEAGGPAGEWGEDRRGRRTCTPDGRGRRRDELTRKQRARARTSTSNSADSAADPGKLVVLFRSPSRASRPFGAPISEGATPSTGGA